MENEGTFTEENINDEDEGEESVTEKDPCVMTMEIKVGGRGSGWGQMIHSGDPWRQRLKEELRS